MYWLSLAVASGVLLWLVQKGNRSVGHQVAKEPTPPAKTKADPIKEALDSNDLKQLLAVADEVQDPVDRHLVLSKIIDQTYKKRSEAAMRPILLEKGRQYLALFPSLYPTLKAEFGDSVYQIPVFKQMAIALDEDGEYNKAIGICRTAIKYDMEDGTKTGYSGRIERIQKKKGNQK
jgi:hypothetical protein